ncbi:MAG: hydrogenase maturation nickel metallochaperone HypA [Ferruginibacter sp.]
MHELSIVMSIIEIAEKQARENNATVVEEIEIDIGELSTVEMSSFDFAWQQAVKDTMLEHSERKINSICGEAVCGDCGNHFSVAHYYDPCPVCKSNLTAIQKGKELRVKSLIVN